MTHYSAIIIFITFLTVNLNSAEYSSTGNECLRDPPAVGSTKKPGDNNLKIVLEEGAGKYLPGRVYTLTLTGNAFTKFYLNAVPLNSPVETMSVGSFMHLNSTKRLTRNAYRCPHIVVHASLVTKERVQVQWVSPNNSGVGCVEFRATIVDSKGDWYKDDGGLTRVFCEDVQVDSNAKNANKDCCACGTAKYKITFEGRWSHLSHPKDYPTQRRLLHWSNIVGASHSDKYQVWRFGDYASRGVKEVCELGYPRTVEEEIRQNSREVRSIIKTPGIWWKDPEGIDQVREARFSVDKRRHFMSLLTMIGPSPDWCLGVSAADLCLPDCTWSDGFESELLPWDAGTDDGLSYMSANAKTEPQQKIRNITNAWPNDPRSPFFGPSPIRPLARLIVEKLGTRGAELGAVGGACSAGEDDSEMDLIGEGEASASEMERYKMSADGGKCEMSPWDDWTSCSVTCGVGQRSRRRMFKNPMANEAVCGLKTIESENCIGTENECETSDEWCAVTQWSMWSLCSATCGTGTMERKRYYLRPQEACQRETQQTMPCNLTECGSKFMKRMTIEECSQPSEAGPCRGNFERWYYNPTTKKCLTFSYGGCRGNKNQFSSMDDCHASCAEDTAAAAAETAVDSPVDQSACLLPSDQGPCKGRSERWHFDKIMGKCLPFQYGGCHGNANNFKTMDDCTERCSLADVNSGSTNNNADKICLLPSDSGPCRSRTEKWYFDKVMGKCLPFQYGGCQGNENRFDTMDACTDACSAVNANNNPFRNINPSVCMLAKDVGPCKASLSRWHFDTNAKKCVEFFYGGCKGNGNRFVTLDECATSCAAAAVLVGRQRQISPDDCRLPAETGPCKARKERWHFDVATNKCLPFEYGGCHGNANRFMTMYDCTDACPSVRHDPAASQPEDSKARCLLDVDAGPCRNNFPNYYYDRAEARCKRFMYGGCLGNANRFAKLNDCVKECDGVRESKNNSAPESNTQPIDCVLTQWSEWTQCSASCGFSFQTRVKQVVKPASSGGQVCPPPQALERRKKCRLLPC